MIRRTVITFHFVLAFVIALPTAGLACQCDCRPAFVEVLEWTELVVLGEVLSYGSPQGRSFESYDWMMVQVNDVLDGSTDCEVITILGDDGRSCRAYITPENFPVGEQFVFALLGRDFDPQPLSICGAHVLQYSGGEVCGRVLTREWERMNYDELRELVELVSLRWPSN